MQEKKSPESIAVRYLKGVGPRKSELFRKIGIDSVNDLFYYLPRRYEDRSRIVPIGDLKPGDTQAVVGRVLKTNIFRASTGTVIFEAAVGDEKARVFAVWYNQPYVKKVFTPGQKVMLYGRVDLQKRLQITHPAFEILEENASVKDSLDIGRIVPIYPLTEGLTQKYLRRTIHNAVVSHVGHEPDNLPTAIRARHKLVDLRFAVENIHFPYSTENLERAYKRLIFEEFFILQTVMALRRRKHAEKGIKHTVKEGLVGDFQKLFGFELTSAQKKCIRDIEKDMSSEKPMYRLLQGDVGSGKTVVAMYALLLAVSGGHQAALMAPTEILARQHYVTVSKTFMPLGLNVRLLVNGIDPADRDMIRKELSEGDADIMIGTHSLFQQGVDYKDLALVVIDEQHKFGVEQRSALRMKGRLPDTLVMTATPIPRSLALTVFGDMDMSLLNEKPKERGDVATYLVEEEKRQAVYEFLRGEVRDGRQAFIVYPRISETNAAELLSAERMYLELKEKIFPDLNIALVHGRMKAAEKDKVMKDFIDGKSDILVATTVIEVGVDVPNVTLMLVEHAERYGLAQLHQLRGRIGRGKHQSYCILMGDAKTEASRERLSTMMETDDGFKIAEKDLDLRGPGEFLGTRQSGLPELRFGNIIRDFKIMEEAREEAFTLVKEDPALAEERHSGIRQAIRERFKGKVGIE